MHAEDAVHRGVRGPDRDVCVSKFPARSSVSVAHSGTRRSSSAIEPALAGGVVLAQRVADEGVVGEDAVQVRMAREVDAVEVPGLALEPVGRRQTLSTLGSDGFSASGQRPPGAGRGALRETE